MRKKIEEEEKREMEKRKRIEKAKAKKEELLERIRNKNNIIIGKSQSWIKRKQSLWRKYRESIGLNSEDESDLRNEIIARIPERVPKDPIVINVVETAQLDGEKVTKTTEKMSKKDPKRQIQI